jgi:hypothetical protein
MTNTRLMSVGAPLASTASPQTFRTGKSRGHWQEVRLTSREQRLRGRMLMRLPLRASGQKFAGAYGGSSLLYGAVAHKRLSKAAMRFALRLISGSKAFARDICNVGYSASSKPILYAPMILDMLLET